MLKIINVEAKKIPGCCVFSYKGFVISASTIFNDSVNVYAHESADIAYSEFYSVEDAIEWINKETSKNA